MNRLLDILKLVFIWTIWTWGLFDSGGSFELRSCFLFFGSMIATIWTVETLEKKAN